MFLARYAKLCGCRSSINSIIQLAWHGDNPTAPVLPWEAIPASHFHKQAMNFNYDVEQENISNNRHRKSLSLNSGAACRVNCRSFCCIENIAILLLLYWKLHTVQLFGIVFDRPSMYDQQKGEILPRHTHTSLLSWGSWLCVATIYHQSLSEQTQLTKRLSNGVICLTC